MGGWSILKFWREVHSELPVLGVVHIWPLTNLYHFFSFSFHFLDMLKIGLKKAYLGVTPEKNLILDEISMKITLFRGGP